jgi:hypothetical protein
MYNKKPRFCAGANWAPEGWSIEGGENGLEMGFPKTLFIHQLRLATARLRYFSTPLRGVSV